MSEEKNKESLNKKEEGSSSNSGKAKVEDTSTKPISSDNSNVKVQSVDSKSNSKVSEKKLSTTDKKNYSNKPSESENSPEKKDVTSVNNVVPSDNIDKKTLSVRKSKSREQNTKGILSKT